MLCEEIFRKQLSSVSRVWEGNANTWFFSVRRSGRSISCSMFIKIMMLLRRGSLSLLLLLFCYWVFLRALAGDDDQIKLANFGFFLILVVEEDDATLCNVSNLKEIRQVVFTIDPDSAPRPNGLCNKFYQSYCNIIRADLLAMFWTILVDLLCLRASKVLCWFFYLRKTPMLLEQVFYLSVFVMLARKC